MPITELSLAIVGADHPNKRGPTRWFGINLCRPGDPIELRPEPRNKVDPNAIAAYAGDVQIGYVRSYRALFIGKQRALGVEITAIFQERTTYGCVIRVGLDCPPTLPEHAETPAIDDDFPPDPIWDDD